MPQLKSHFTALTVNSHAAFLLGALFCELFLFHIAPEGAVLNNLGCCGRFVRSTNRIVQTIAEHSPELGQPRKGGKFPSSVLRGGSGRLITSAVKPL